MKTYEFQIYNLVGTHTEIVKAGSLAEAEEIAETVAKSYGCKVCYVQQVESFLFKN